MLNVKSMQLALNIVQKALENNYEFQHVIERQLHTLKEYLCHSEYFKPGDPDECVPEEVKKILMNQLKVPDIEGQPQEEVDEDNQDGIRPGADDEPKEEEPLTAEAVSEDKPKEEGGE